MQLNSMMERVKGIEPSSSAWKAVALPLSYTRARHQDEEWWRRLDSNQRTLSERIYSPSPLTTRTLLQASSSCPCEQDGLEKPAKSRSVRERLYAKPKWRSQHRNCHFCGYRKFPVWDWGYLPSNGCIINRKADAAMPTIGAYYFETNRKPHDAHPLLFLHGSARTETDGAEFVARLSTGRLGIFLRGPHQLRRGYSFVLREDDFSLNYQEITTDALALAAFLPEITQQSRTKPPIVIGYSSGAIMTAALLWHNPDLVAGAVLLRPQPPSLDPPVALKGLPILLLPGAWDERRDPEDANIMEYKLKEAGARVTHLTVQSDHGEAPDGSDLRFTRNWLEENFAGR